MGHEMGNDEHENAWEYEWGMKSARTEGRVFWIS